MLVISFFQWWFSKGWFEFGKKIIARLGHQIQFFSISTLLRTLFAPWKRITTIAGKSIGEKLRAFFDNLISRIVGFFTRVIVLIAAFITLILTAILGLALFIAWPFSPFLVVFLIFKAFL